MKKLTTNIIVLKTNASINIDRDCCTIYLFALGVFPTFPGGETWTPVFQDVRFGVLLTLALAETTLSSDGCNDMR